MCTDQGKGAASASHTPMPSPFPGMNPYLENPALWSEVHHWIITLIAELLVPKLRPKERELNNL